MVVVPVAVVVGRNQLVMVVEMSDVLGSDYCMDHVYLVVQVRWVTVAWNGKVLMVEMGIGIVDNIGQMPIEYTVVRTGKIDLQ